MTAETLPQRESRTKGRLATKGVIEGRFALSVGMPVSLPAPRGWTWTPLDAVAQLESGHTPSRKHDEYWNGGVPWIGIRDAVDNHGRTIRDTYQKISRAGLANSSARLLPKRTVCLSRTASVGYVVVMGESMATSQDFVNWVCGPHLDPDYLKYILIAEHDSLFQFASGTTHQTIYYPEAKAFHALLPTIGEQSKILSILRGLDDKIDVNRRTNETLEAMAQALFKSWFVDFDPVFARKDGRKLDGIDSATAALFPNDIEQSELGPVPRGWAARPLAQLTSYLSRGIGPTYVETGGVPVLNQRCIRNGRVDRAQGRLHDASKRSVEGRVLQRFDILVNSTGVGTLGRVAQVDALPEPTVVDSHVTVVRPDLAQVDVHYLGMSLLRRQTEIELLGEGSTGQTELSRARLGGLPVLHPGLLIQEQFSTRVAAQRRAITAREQESITLANLRDALLPKLLSGELRVPDVERLVGKAV